MKLTLGVLLICAAGCQTVTPIETWQNQAFLAMQADRINLEGFSNKPRVLDVILETKATADPMLSGQKCTHSTPDKHFNTVATRHRFRTKPGKVSIVIPKLPNSEMAAVCRPQLSRIKVIEISNTGVKQRSLASIANPKAGKVTLNFDDKTR